MNISPWTHNRHTLIFWSISSWFVVIQIHKQVTRFALHMTCPIPICDMLCLTRDKPFLPCDLNRHMMVVDSCTYPKAPVVADLAWCFLKTFSWFNLSPWVSIRLPRVIGPVYICNSRNVNIFTLLKSFKNWKYQLNSIFIQC